MFNMLTSGNFWILVAAVTLVIEFISLGLTSIWFTGGALVAAVAAYLGAPIWLQVVLFIVISTALLLGMRPFAKKKLKVGTEKTNIDSLIGRTENVLEEVDNTKKSGRIRIGDVDWRVVSEDGSVIPVGTVVKIVKLEGTRLYVKRDIDTI